MPTKTTHRHRTVAAARSVLVVVERLGKQTMLSDTLELNGYEVTTAGSGSHALQKIDALGIPDIVVMDADLSLMSRRADDFRPARSRLRRSADPAGQAAAQPIDRDDLPPIRHIRFIEKPVSVNLLLRSVREELDAPDDAG